MPVEQIGGELTTRLALPPEEGGFANDPVLGLVQNLGLEGLMLDVAKIYVGVLAATILFIATNAGVIGASRITYSMASYRQLPEVSRRLHPRFKTPWLAIVVFAGIAPIAILLPGDVNFVGTLYSFGATFSFTVAHASIIRLRMLPAGEDERIGRAGPNLGIGGVDWPLFAIVGGLATAVSFLVILAQNEATRWTGIGWIVLGLIGYAIYRRVVLREPVRATVRAPVAFGPALALEYRRLLVPILPGQASDDALDRAASLAAERGAQIAAITVLEVPLDQPLDVELDADEAVANRELDEARAIGDSYGVAVIPRLVRGRSAGEAIVAEATRRGTELIVLGALRKEVGRRRRAVFGATVDYVLKHATCRVMVTASSDIQ
ncbi:MAG: amino acid permease [Gaiellaceae bacterium]